MGLDAVEIVLRTEELFDITIAVDEAGPVRTVRTVRGFYHLICSKHNVTPLASPVTSAELPIITQGRTCGGAGSGVCVERNRNFLTQEEVAQAMGTTQAVVARLESGKVLPSTRTLERFAKATRSRLRITFEPHLKTAHSKSAMG